MRLPSLLGALLHHARHPSPEPPREEEPAMAASASEPAESTLAKVALECGGDISASQEEILANSSFLGGDNVLSASEGEEEVFATPPDATQQPQDDSVTMCTLPFTPTPIVTKSPAAPPSDDDVHDHMPLTERLRKPRVSTRKVKVRGARISTPTPSPEHQQHSQQQQQQQQQPQPEQPVHVDPLVRAVLMMPTRTNTAAAATASSSRQDAVKDFIALARQKGIF